MNNLLWDKLDTDGKALLLDFDRYRAMAHLSEARNFILDCKIAQWTQAEIRQALQIKFGLVYGENRLYTIICHEIPDAIVEAIKRYHLILNTPDKDKKICPKCGRLLPKVPLFWVVNNNRKDKFNKYCKECEKAHRIAKGVQGQNDGRKKETHVH